MSEYISIRSGATALPEQSVSHLPHDIVLQSGVLDLAGNYWKVSEHNPQNMSIDIATGRGYFRKTTVTYHGYSDAVKTVVVTSNSSGNGRIDAAVAYVDLGATPNSDASNVLKFVVVAGTPASSPVAPTDNEIQTSIGSGNPFIRLANIAVANGASSIVNANITDTRVPCYFKFTNGLKNSDVISPRLSATYHKVFSGNVAGATALECGEDGYNMFLLTLGAAATLSLNNMRIGQSINVIFTNATAYAITWPTNTYWPDNVTPTPVGNYNGFILFCYATGKYIGIPTFNNVSAT